MKPLKVAVFDTKPYVEEYFNAGNKEYKFQLTYFPNHLDSTTAQLAHGHEVVCAFINDKITPDVIRTLQEEDVRLIALRSAGYNNVDLKAAYAKIHVVRVPSYSPYAIAEHAVALMMTLNRKTHRAYFRTRDGNFLINGLMGFDMNGKTVGIIGLGKIGKCLVSILRGFGMNVLAFDKYQDDKYAAESGIKYVSLEEIYKDSDIISLNCPLTPETEKMINETSLAKMKNGVMMINTGRGKLIDTKALIDALKSGKVGSAGLDVYEEEEEYFFEDFSSSMIDDDTLARLLTFPNVLVTSHQAFFTKEAMENIVKTTFDNIKDFFEGKFLQNEICYRCNLTGTDQCLKKQGKRCF